MFIILNNLNCSCNKDTVILIEAIVPEGRILMKTPNIVLLKLVIHKISYNSGLIIFTAIFRVPRHLYAKLSCGNTESL